MIVVQLMLTACVITACVLHWKWGLSRLWSIINIIGTLTFAGYWWLAWYGADSITGPARNQTVIVGSIVVGFLGAGVSGGVAYIRRIMGLRRVNRELDRQASWNAEVQRRTDNFYNQQ